MMTLDQFRATGVECEDLAAALSDDQDLGAGRIYIGCLYIERTNEKWLHPENGEWHLLLGNCEWQTNDLPRLEALLYEYAMSEGFLDE